ncbi:MAG: hypothetical protein KatS3mg046_088 [Bellilinea sp.]|nr:MAG: hypothetical protein KatS3mg046_088 [Bellilinea sp.]
MVLEREQIILEQDQHRQTARIAEQEGYAKVVQELDPSMIAIPQMEGKSPAKAGLARKRLPACPCVPPNPTSIPNPYDHHVRRILLLTRSRIAIAIPAATRTISKISMGEGFRRGKSKPSGHSTWVGLP